MKTPKSTEMFGKVDEWKNWGKKLRKSALSIGLSKSALGYWVYKRRKWLSHSPNFVELLPLVKPGVEVTIYLPPVWQVN